MDWILVDFDGFGGFSWIFVDFGGFFRNLDSGGLDWLDMVYASMDWIGLDCKSQSKSHL